MTDFDFGRLQMGLRQPQTEEDAKTEATINGMRKAIIKAQRDSPLIRNVLNAAWYQGLRGEDTYVLLAYHALQMLEDHYQRNMEFIKLMPVPPIIVKRPPDQP